MTPFCPNFCCSSLVDIFIRPPLRHTINKITFKFLDFIDLQHIIIYVKLVHCPNWFKHINLLVIEITENHVLLDISYSKINLIAIPHVIWFSTILKSNTKQMVRIRRFNYIQYQLANPLFGSYLVDTFTVAKAIIIVYLDYRHKV